MKKKLSIVLALLVMAFCIAFAFSAYADEAVSNTEETIQAPIRITNENTVITLSASTFTYNAKEIKPVPTVIYKEKNGKSIILSKYADYTVSYLNNKNAGTATVKINFKNKYSGSLNKKFTIKPLNISGKAFSASLNYTSAVYTGKNIYPSIAVYWNQDGKKVKLVHKTEFEVKYSANRNVGKATVTAVGTKNFTGSIKKTFNILPNKVTGFKAKSKTTNSITLSWSKLTNITGYQIFKYDQANKKYVQLKKVSADKTSYTVSGLDSSAAYCFKMRAYKQLSDGKTVFYGEYSSSVVEVTNPEKVTLTSVTKSGGTINVNWKKTRSSGYSIAYSTDKSFKKNVKTVNVPGYSKTTYSIKNVNKNANYYVKIRAYYTYKNKTYYGAYSSPLSTNYSNLYKSYSSYYDEKNVNRTTNLKIASKAISGTIIQPGQTFSFNKIVGPRTKAKGYKPAAVFNASGTGIGGGICQVASTIFNCALNANVEIVERHQHNQRVSYVPLGRDAAIYETVQDFKWKNTTKYPIKVVMTVSNGKITCSFYTNVKAAPPAVSLKVTQNGRNFTLRRTVNKKVNYTAYSTY